jgi:DNA-binding beta-propeller fold protein YncE
MKKKRLCLILTILLVFIFSTSGLSYETLITADISIEDNLTGLSINPTTGMVVAASSKTKTLYLIDTITNTVIKTHTLSITPSGIAVDILRNMAIVSSKDGKLYFIDLETGNPIKTLSEDSSINSIAINMATDSLFICNDNGFMVMDLETENILNKVSLPYVVKGIIIDSNLGYLLMIMEGKEGLYLYNADTLEPITEINTGIIHSAISVNSSTHIALLINDSESSISVLSIENKNLLDTIRLSEKPDIITIDPVSFPYR